MTILTDLPTAITDYFTLLNAADKRATINVLTPDAVVTDDGKTYRGRDEILRWLSTAASEYTVTTTRLSAESSGDTVTVTTRLEGDFPGGLVDLRNIFTLHDSGLIESMLITV